MSSIFRSFKATKPLNRITFYHNPNSAASLYLLEKLNRFSELPSTFNRFGGASQTLPPQELGKFSVELKESKIPNYEEYTQVHDFLHMHPENALSFEQVFPVMFDSEIHTLCKKTATKTNKQQKFLGDLETFSREEYEMIHNAFKQQPHSNIFRAPLVVDWENSLIAVGEKGLDRIMANYLSCGIQDTGKGDYNYSYKANNQRKNTIDQHSHTHVHPHVAEFADLF